jgi:esterase/lipase superfamily enzyme
VDRNKPPGTPLLKLLRAPWFLLTVAGAAIVIYVLVRYFLNSDVTPSELLLMEGAGISLATLLAGWLARRFLEPVLEWVPTLLGIPDRRDWSVGVVALVSDDKPDSAWRAGLESARRVLPMAIRLAVIAILGYNNPIWIYARSNSRAVVTVFYITDRASAAPNSFSESPGSEKLSFGKAQILKPISQSDSEFNNPYSIRRGKADDYEVVEVSPLTEDQFFDEVNKKLHASSSQEFVFVHGFATKFFASLTAAGQLAGDLKFKGAPIVFSWPAGNIYPTDKENAIWAAKHVRQSLAALKTRTAPDHLHLLAHSMGSMVVGLAIDGSMLPKDSIDNLVLAAPDLNEAMFSQYSTSMKTIAKRVTIYVSRWDRALELSEMPQAGRIGLLPVSRPGFDVIDTEAVDRPASFWGAVGHSYVYNSQMVLNDLASLIYESKPPDDRLATVRVSVGCWRLEKRTPS